MRNYFLITNYAVVEFFESPNGDLNRKRMNNLDLI